MAEERSVIAFLTGQSVRHRTALSGAERNFMAGLPGAGTVKVEVNFPYHADPRPYAIPFLPIASMNNIIQYLRSRSPSFAIEHRGQVCAILSPYDRVFLLAGSCGLELLVNLDLPRELLVKTHVFAYGPVSRAVPRCASLMIVQGRKDFISRHWHRRVDHYVDCSHMRYLESAEIKELFLRFYLGICNGTGGPAR